MQTLWRQQKLSQQQCPRTRRRVGRFGRSSVAWPHTSSEQQQCSRQGVSSRRGGELHQDEALEPPPPLPAPQSQPPSPAAYSFASYLQQHSQWQGARSSPSFLSAASQLVTVTEASPQPHLLLAEVAPALPHGARELLADALLILRAAQTDATLDARSLADWALQACSADAAALATAWVQYGSHSKALSARFSELASRGLGLARVPLWPPPGSSSSSSSSSSSRGDRVSGLVSSILSCRDCSSGSGGTIPSLASRLAAPVFSGSWQQVSSFVQDREQEALGQSQAPPAQTVRTGGRGLNGGSVLRGPAGNGSSSEDEDAEAAQAQAEEAAAIEAAAVAAAGARSTSEEPPAAPRTTTTSARSNNGAPARPPRALQRPATPPPRSRSPEVPDSGDEEAFSREGSPSPSPAGAAGVEGTVEAEERAAASAALLGLMEERPRPRTATRIITQPMQLVPLTPHCALRDPHTGSLLPGSAPGQQACGVSVPTIGPWVLTNAARHFPAAEAEVVLPPHAQQQQQPRLCLRFEHVLQRGTLGEGELAGAAEELDVMRQQQQQLQQGEDQGQEGQGAVSQGATQQSEPSSVQVPGSASSSLLSRDGAGDAEAEVVHSPLTLFNTSRTVRGNPKASAVFVERQLPPPSSQHRSEEGGGGADSGSAEAAQRAGQQTQCIALRQGARGLPLQHGDVLIVGTAQDAPRFRVEQLELPAGGQDAVQATSALVDDALTRFAPPSASDPGQPPPGPHSHSQQQHRKGAPGPAAAMAQLQQLARQARSNPGAAFAGYHSLLASNMGNMRANSYAWIAWAQVAGQLRQLRVARALFRVAHAVAERGCEAAAIAATRLEQQQQQQQQQQQLEGVDGAASSSSSSSSSSQGGAGAGSDPATAATMPLVQVLFTWGRFEWHRTKLWGSARHLWRAAAYACSRHPGGPQAGGAGVVLHAWASAELERDNVRNARIVLAEALRKCPDDQPLYVLAAGVELAGGDPELAKDFCLRAYEMNRSDKHLYLVWPRVMAALKEYEKARVLFERGLEYHPRNTKIMGAYANFEADIGGDPNMARELLLRALKLDSSSETGIQNRLSLAMLEARSGRLGRARVLLAEIVARNPGHLSALLSLARVQRMRGELEGAQVTLWQAKKCSHAFNMELQKERAAVYRALGEDDLARGLEAHCRAVAQLQQAKKEGASTAEAWQVYESACQQPEHRKAAHRAYERKVELGWLSAPGVPGPNAARTGGSAFRPLKRTKVAEERARAEAEAAAARAEAQQREAEAAAQQQADEAAAASAAAMEQWEQEQGQEQGKVEGGLEQPEGGRSSRSKGSSSSCGSSRSRASGSREREQSWYEEDDGHSFDLGSRSRSRRSSSGGGMGARRAWGEEEEDVGAPLLPAAYELDDLDDKDEE